MQLGILNVIEAMELDPEVVYSIYLAASADRYVWVPLGRHKIVYLTSLDAILFINMQILFSSPCDWFFKSGGCCKERR